jgi:AcrR family transcriptional regulator
MSTESTTNPRHMRADARRNRERIIAAANEAFHERGAEATMDEIARRAGVGIGTLYRHFPTWNALLDVILHDWAESERIRTREMLATSAPAEALEQWFRRHVDKVRTHRGLSKTMLSNLENDALKSPMKAITRESGNLILARAQEIGAVRPDITVDDLLKLAYAVALATEQSPDDADRLISVVMDGLRVTPSTGAVS